MLALAQQLVMAGYTAKQILNFLSNKVNGLSKSIQGARSGGYNDDQILQFLSKKLPKGQTQQAEQNASHAERYMSGIGFKTKEEKAQQRQKNIQGLTGLAAGALTAYAGYRALSQAPQAISSLFGQGTNPTSPTGPGPTGGAQIGNVPTAGRIQAPVSPQVPVTPQIPQVGTTAAPPAAPSPKTPNVIQQMGLNSRIDNLKNAGNAPNVIAEVLKSQLTVGQKQFVKDNKIDLDQAVQEYVSSAPQQTLSQENTPMIQPNQGQITPEKQPISPNREEISPKNEIIEQNQPNMETQEEEPSPAPGKSVALPDGSIGEISKIDPKGRFVKVNVDGKERNVKFSDISVEPENVVEFVNHIAQIPESERSRMISYFAYQPETKTLAVQFHNGQFYTYSDVDPEKLNAIVEAKGVAKTTGSDEYGSHIAGRPDSRGAALIEEIINDPKYKKSKKGETKNANYQAFDTLYDYWKAFRRVAKGKRKKIGTQS